MHRHAATADRCSSRRRTPGRNADAGNFRNVAVMIGEPLGVSVNPSMNGSGEGIRGFRVGGGCRTARRTSA